MIRRFSEGISAFFEGVKLLKTNRSLRVLGFIPAIMSLTLFTAGLIVGFLYIDDIMTWVIKSNINNYGTLVKSLIYILSFLLLSFILYFATFLVVSLLSVPVCTSLSQNVLTQVGYLKPSSKNVAQNILNFANMLRVSIIKFIFILVISIFLFLASFIPVISPVALYLSLMILTLDCMDYAMEHDEMGFRNRLQFFITNWPEFSGFALCMAIILAIPFIHFILLPSSVIGTSVLYARIRSREKGIQ